MRIKKAAITVLKYLFLTLYVLVLAGALWVIKNLSQGTMGSAFFGKGWGT